MYSQPFQHQDNYSVHCTPVLVPHSTWLIVLHYMSQNIIRLGGAIKLLKTSNTHSAV